MKKILSKIASTLSIISFVIPTAACTFNNAINTVKNKIASDFAQETSNVLKSLVLSKEKGFATKSSIDNFFQNYPLPSVQNNDSNFNTVNDFINSWGENGKIKTKNFNLNNYFIADNKSNISNEVENTKNIDSTLNSLTSVLAIGVVNNPLLTNFLENNSDTKDTITNFFQNTLNLKKSNNSNVINTIESLVKNTFLGNNWANSKYNHFTNNVYNPLKNIFNYLINNNWENNTPAPTNFKQMTNFMSNWKDYEGNYISQNANNGNWKPIDKNYKNWNSEDFAFYRAGSLLNYLFYVIGKDNGIDQDSFFDHKYPGGSYLSTILSYNINEYISISSIISNPAAMIKNLLTNLENDLLQFLPYFLENPYYILTAIDACLPLVKYILFSPDSNIKIQYLTFGKKYKKSLDNNSFNIDELISKISNFFKNKNWINQVINFIDQILGISDKDNKPLLSDLNLNMSTAIKFGLWINNPISIQDLIKALLDSSIAKNFVTKNTINNQIKGIFINNKNEYTNLSNQIISIVNLVQTVYNQWIKQYNDTNSGIKLDLTKFMNYLFNSKNGLLTLINNQVSNEIYKILKEKTFKEQDYKDLFSSLGIEFSSTIGGDAPYNFKPDSVISIFLTSFNDNNTFIRQVVNIIFGDFAKKYTGFIEVIFNNNEKWINDNYGKYFSVNKSNASISKIKLTTNKNNNDTTDYLQYDFKYTINKKTYNFFVKCVSNHQNGTPDSVKNFKFSEIDLL